MNDEKDLEMPIAKNAPGFDAAPVVTKAGDDPLYDFSADLNILPVDNIGETDANGVPSSVPIKIVTKKFHTPSTTQTSPVQTTPASTSAVLPTTPGREPSPTDVERPIAPPSPTIPSNIPNREQIFTPPAVQTPAPVAPILTPAPTPVTPNVVPPVQEAAPFVPPAKPILTFSADGSVVPVATPGSAQPSVRIPLDPNLKSIRTYESDVAEAMARGKTSLAEVSVAEAKKRQAEAAEGATQEPQHPHGSASKAIFIVLLIIILIGTGVMGAFYFYSKSPLAPVTVKPPTPSAPEALIPSDSYSLFATDKLSPSLLKSAFIQELNKPLQAGSIKEIIPTKKVGTETMRISGQELIALLDIPMPNLLLRSFGQASMVGIYADPNGRNDAFVVLSSDFLQNSFAGMLQWETSMASDLKFYLLSDIVTPTTASSTKSTANTVRTFPTIRGKFVNRIIKNKDVREFVDDKGKIIFLYSFVDNTKLVITDSESTLLEIIGRLEKAASVR